MMDEGPGPHDRHLMEDGGDTVPCARCGQEVWEGAERCPHCGVHFAGEAWEFASAGGKGRARLPRWVVVTAWVLAVVLILIWGLHLL